MHNKYVLKPELMLQLKEIGIDTSNSLLYWELFEIMGLNSYELQLKRNYVHNKITDIDAFSIEEAKDILPRIIKVGETTYILNFEYSEKSFNILYSDEECIGVLHEESNEDQGIALVNMIKWCKENGYI